jgi:hypothetical protein
MSENPLLVPPRQRTIEIYPGDVEETLADLNARIAAAVAEERPGEKRMGSKPEALALAEEFDAVVEGAKDRAVRITIKEVPNVVLRQLVDEHPPRKGNKIDEGYGFNEDAFFPALIRRAWVSPEVEPEQFDEWVAGCSAHAWNKLCMAAYELATGEVSLPKSSAVSAVRRLRGSDSEQPPASE